MTTKKQIEANRRNAQKSTGPKTPEGKEKSARNALKHGLLSARPVLPQEDPMEYEHLRGNLHKELCPEGQLETLLVNRIAAAQWRLGRVPALEAALFERLAAPVPGADGPDTAAAHLEPSGDPLRDLAAGLGLAWERDSGPYGGALGRLARYETMLERSTTRLLAELRRHQAFRTRMLHNEAIEARAEGDRRRAARRLAGTSPGRAGVADLFRDMDPAEAWLAARSGALGSAQAGAGLTPPGLAAGLPLSDGAACAATDAAPGEGREPARRAGGGGEAPAPGEILPNEPDLILGPTLRTYAERPADA